MTEPFKPTSGLRPGTLKRIAETHTNDVGLAKPEVKESGLHRQGLERIVQANADASAAALTTQQRKNLPGTSFVFPGKAPGPGSYPIPDKGHAANALARAKGKPEFATVRKAVCARYPDLPDCGG